MAYQALLFCPDDKTCRSVTQVLSELDFTVIPCTEPFAAVKKMMGERFDAVVVDCDNEQNATLLFKSARNTANNQSSLAVAVVEGQAGVAKAFRIGANLVLTKPINVEQAKGTLRVARGLLRKNEAAKSSTPAAGVPVKPAPVAPSAKAPEAATPVRDRKPAPPISHAPAASAATPTAKSPKTFQAKEAIPVTAEADEPEIEVLESDDEPVVSPAPKSSIAPVVSGTPSAPAKPGLGLNRAGSAAAAPAPARDSKSALISGKKAAAVATAKPAVQTEPAPQTAPVAQESTAIPSTPGPSFTFGGAIEEKPQAEKSGSMNVLLAVAAVLLIAAAGFTVWMKLGSSATTPSHSVVPQPAKVPAVAPATPVVPASASRSSSLSEDTSAVPASMESTPTESPATPHSAPPPVTSASTPARNAKPSAGSETGRHSASTPAESKTAVENTTVAKSEPQPLVIKGGPARQTAKPPTVDATAPSLDGITATATAAPMSNLMVGDNKAPAPVLQTMKISQGVSQGLLIKRVNPVYPATALHMRLEGTVQLLATVSGKGDITGIKVLSGDLLLSTAATEAVKQWKYKPYLLNGSPVEIQTEITVKFKLPQ
jgi:TonB family protein